MVFSSKFFFILIFIFLSTFPNSVNSKSEETSSNKQNELTKIEEKKEEEITNSTIKPPEQPCICSTQQPGEMNDESNGFGAGSIFLSIMFGMGLMFGLTQLYTYWEKRRSGDLSTYPGY
ncbi:hypothetical protein Mgra_00000988 [Meloidogyne graminicola]|uniref:Transmembrane protein n=1 Tax=Meloidogyne graminicola TaxID=189291 RepID=A0A8T0A284_9BILA|nr:hypothetical protein Mgra_00000988 [Meloidogyne graminicola]